MDEIDRQLIALLRENARVPIATLAKKLRVARGTVHGVLGQSLATVPLTRILDITVRRPLHGRLLGFGHFCFESAAQEQGVRDVRYVGRPIERDLAIQRVVQRSGARGRTVG